MDFSSFVENMKMDIIRSAQELVMIPSMYSNDKSPYPFGEQIDNCLKKTLEICKGLGFRTFYGDGYYGYAEIGPIDDSIDIVGVLCHIDVVPPGNMNDWVFDPFGARLHDGKIYGRGSQDDKGPTVSAIYALKAILDSNVHLAKRIRIIFGTDEETLWRDIAKYKERETFPKYCFTPDSKFPLINAEKALLQFKLRGRSSTCLSLRGGTSINSVPDKILYSSRNNEEAGAIEKSLVKHDFEYSSENGIITVFGKAAHASKVHLGTNSISRMCIALKDAGLNSPSTEFIANEIGEDYSAKKIFGICKDELSGKLTFNIAKIDVSCKGEEILVDCRIPVSIGKDFVVDSIVACCSKYNLEYDEIDYLSPLYVPEESALVQTLQRVFFEHTGIDARPLSSGGTTYAKAFENCVAYGPIFPNQKKVEHQANEYISVENLVECSKIYSRALYELSI